MKRKSGLSKLNAVLAVILVVCIAATAIVINQYPKITEQASTETTNEDVSVLEKSFEAGTYGGKDFQSIEDVVNYYNECYNYTKTLTAQYTENGETKEYYKLLGDENLNVGNLLVEGKSNGTLDSLVPGIVGGLFKGSPHGLSPSSSKMLSTDTKVDGTVNCATSMLTAEDVLDANVVDNNDGTITITIQPKAVLLSMPGQDAQGHFFNSLGDISSVVNSIDALSFSQGTIDENFVVNYKGGTGKITIDTKTGEITAADYEMLVHIDVIHANVLVLKDKSASLDISYTNHFPASDEFLAKYDMARK
ncbi:MAG: hypothetical protein NC213_08735 [Acetobacter sp.]|nr:hypothetical protein [Bacteroides sp.]MCM1341814.1 hypothetical protein [Acetobacter sp.]MCM1433980.1 hypothetical protein [Clostridiales bacterium]